MNAPQDRKFNNNNNNNNNPKNKRPQTFQLLHYRARIRILSSDTTALTENASSPCRGVSQDELRGVHFSLQPQKGNVIEKITKINFSARTSASMSTGTDHRHSPRRQATMVTVNYIKHRLPTQHTTNANSVQISTRHGRKEVLAVKSNCT
jgi:hypothetical protein